MTADVHQQAHSLETEVVRPAPVSVSETRFRVGAALVFLSLFILGQILLRSPIPILGQIALSIFLQCGPGVALCLFLRALPRHLFVLLSIAAGTSIGTIVSSLAALTGAVAMSTVWLVLAGLTMIALVVAAARGLWIRRRQPAAAAEVETAVAEHAAPRRRWVPVVLGIAGAAIALLATAAHHGLPRPDGAAVTAGPFWFVGVAVVLVSFGLAWRWGSTLAAPVLILTSVVVASQALMYREPSAVVAAKHVGLVDYILANGRLDRSVDIYQAWAGLFADTALNVRAARIEDIFAFATWWGALAAPVMVLAVRALAGRFLSTRRAWLAALVFGLGSSLNTSFFAPQVFGFILATTVLALLVVRPGTTAGLSTPLSVGISFGISVAMALAHQISPYMLVLALIALAFFRLVRPRWAFLIPLLPAVTWALINRHLLNSYISIDAIGRLTNNLSPPTNNLGVLPEALSNKLAFQLPAAALVVIGLLALRSLIRARGRLGWGLTIAAASPVLLSVGTNYGNEGIFRVVLFSLPWLAVLLFLPPSRPGLLPFPERAKSPAVAGLLTVLLVVQVTGLTAMDWARVIRTNDVEAARWYEDSAPQDSVILTLGTDLTMPTDSTAAYQKTGWVSRSSLVPDTERPYPTTTGAAYDADADLQRLTTLFAKVSGTGHYAIAADSIGAYDQRYGNQRYSDYLKLTEAIARSPKWRRVYSGSGDTIYQLRASEHG